MTSRLVIVIGADDSLQLSGAPVTLDDLAVALEAVANNDGEVLLAAHREATHGIVVRVMDLARRAGVHHLDIETTEPVS